MTERLAPRPAILSELPKDRHALIEASAGTGKTFTIEHLLADWLLTTDVSIDQLLVVTFTDKATAELKQRVRRLLERLARPGPVAPSSDAPGGWWRLDAPAQQRLQRALGALDTATISTIHGFCRRLLNELAFAGGQSFEPTLVPAATAFAAAWRDSLRRELARDPALVPWLTQALSSGRSLHTLEQLLFECASDQALLRPTFSPEALAAALGPLRGCAAHSDLLASIRQGLQEAKVHHSTAKALVGRLESLLELVGRLPVAGPERSTTPPVPSPDVPAVDPAGLAQLVAELDQLDRTDRDHGGVLRRLCEGLGRAAATPKVAELLAALRPLGRAMVSFDAAFAAVALPVVMRNLEAHKRRHEQYDFDDLLVRVRDGLIGGGLLAPLRARYRVGLVDEFQDTNEVQWAIFRTLFDLDRAAPGAPVPRPLYLVGDPKQSIYGFRGGDLATYLRARDEVMAGGGAQLTLLDNYRSTAAVVAGCNLLLDAAARPALLTPPNRYANPVRCGRPELVCRDERGDEVPPLALLELGDDAGELEAEPLRARIAERIAGEITHLLRAPLRVGPNPGALRPITLRDVFVLTRKGVEGLAVAAALARRDVPHVLHKQDGLFDTDEARGLLRLLQCLLSVQRSSPRVERSVALQAALTPFFPGSRPPSTDTRLRLPDDEAVRHIEGRLLDWSTLATARDYERLVPRLLLDVQQPTHRPATPEEQRRRLDLLQLCELLLEEGVRRRCSLAELARTLDGWRRGTVPPPAERGDSRRASSDSDAVRVLTIHASKGLEAEVVFLAAVACVDSGPARTSRHRTHLFHEGRQRCRYVGPPLDPDVRAAVERERALEDERLVYVALTRARSRLYLPFRPAAEPGTTAPPLQQRLTALLAYGSPLLLRMGPRDATVANDVASTEPPAEAAPRTGVAADFAPSADPWAPWMGPTPAPEALRARGPLLLSYSRLEVEPTVVVLDEELDDLSQAPAEAAVEPAGGPAADDELRGGSAVGVLLHTLLEELPWHSLNPPVPFEAWAGLPEVEAVWRRHLDRPLAPRAHAGAAVSDSLSPGERELLQRIAYGTLAQPLPLPPGRPPFTFAQVARPHREVEFFYPVMDGATGRQDGGAPRGDYVWGFIDLLFEAPDGRAYFADWKTDRLPRWDEATIAAQVEHRYSLQLRLYLVALVKLLGVTSEADYQRQVGGALYCFVRAMAALDSRGVHHVRPPWTEVEQWLLRPIP